MKTPTLILNKLKCQQNIQNMKSFCNDHQMDFRPHFKTHQSAEIGEWFKVKGVEKCTVSSVGMANYFAKAGWKDICIAIPLNINELEDVEPIAHAVNLSLCVDHPDHIKALKNLSAPLKIFIEIDSGYGRSGVYFKNTTLMDDLIFEMEHNKQLEFTGFLSHTGNSYHSQNSEDGSQVFAKAR